MKKIVPFNNVLKFNTDISEITAISLEHEIKTESNIIEGIFYISGEYKIMDGGINTLPFKFDLPFDIALSETYDDSTLKVDIDDFRYELIEKNKIKVNIDLSIDGETIKIVEEPKEEVKEETLVREEPKIITSINNENININNNIELENEEKPNEKEDNYVTYCVYRVNEGDNISNILEKYHVTKEELMEYNDNLENIKPGDKLIIPSK